MYLSTVKQADGMKFKHEIKIFNIKFFKISSSLLTGEGWDKWGIERPFPKQFGTQIFRELHLRSLKCEIVYDTHSSLKR